MTMKAITRSKSERNNNMEKKTIGSFIAALRKANGITQKELAERLNVSDKTVSRWECDDGSPDLSLIPTIAEIFGVTCDELLRGERRSPTERDEILDDTAISLKGEKQRQRLLKSTLSKFKSMTYIAMGVSVVGLIAALICNFAFLKAVLGFLIALIFYASSIVCQAVFINRALLSVDDAGLDDPSVSEFKRTVIRLMYRSIGLTVVLAGFTLPLIMVDNAYNGLLAETLLVWGGLSALVFLLVFAVILYFINGSLLKKGVYSLNQKELTVYMHNRKLKKKYAVILVIVLTVTALLHVLGSEALWSADSLSSNDGITFNDYDSFIEYMQRDNPADGHENDTYYDDDGNEISEEEALTRTLEDINGNVVCTYIERNEDVIIRYALKEGTVLPIQVISADEYRAAEELSNTISAAYCILYLLEFLVVLLVYRKKKTS